MVEKQIFNDENRFVLLDLKDKKYWTVNAPVEKLVDTDDHIKMVVSVKFSVGMENCSRDINIKMLENLFDCVVPQQYKDQRAKINVDLESNKQWEKDLKKEAKKLEEKFEKFDDKLDQFADLFKEFMDSDEDNIDNFVVQRGTEWVQRSIDHYGDLDDVDLIDCLKRYRDYVNRQDNEDLDDEDWDDEDWGNKDDNI